MTRKRTDGYCLVSLRDGSSFSLRRDQYAKVRHAWLHGVKHLDVLGMHGDPGTIELASVNAVFDTPASTVMDFLEEQRSDEADDSLAGGGVA